ncbi:hypothetical protein [Flammeovirga sp. SJP92]|uniref:hypothetical protein n=1 Tax=Flammeovirga sp. SJP92 TaxID=1775430 RepID=UPI0012FCD868|nr:hypothetical protein [Flammeovirga sp. SJP92]
MEANQSRNGIIKKKLLIFFILSITCICCRTLVDNRNISNTFPAEYFSSYEKLVLYENGSFFLLNNGSMLAHPIEECDTISKGVWRLNDHHNLVLNSIPKPDPKFSLEKNRSSSRDSLYFYIEKPNESFALAFEVMINKKRILTIKKDRLAVLKSRYINKTGVDLFEVSTLPDHKLPSYPIFSDSINTDSYNSFVIKMPQIGFCDYEYQNFESEEAEFVGKRKIVLNNKVFIQN